ncbi:hypothetical protein ACYOEI_02500 [Singulisphaera rosea]
MIPDYRTGTTSAEVVGEHSVSGTIVTVEFGASLPVPGTALRWAEDAIAMARNGGPSYTGKPSPHWFDPDSFFELLQAAKERTIRDLVAGFDGCAEPKAGKIVAGFKGRLSRDLTRGEADQLKMILMAHVTAVRPSRLGCVGRASHLPAAYAKEEGTFSIRTGSGPETLLPVVVEAWAEVHDGNADGQLFVNRTPVTAPFKASYSKPALTIQGCGLSIRVDTGRRPGRLLLNITTPYMPITSDGKAPNLGPMLEMIRSAIGQAFKRAKKLASAIASSPTEGKVSQKDIIVARIPDAVAKASGDGQYRFSIRQLYYAVRPYVLEAMRVEPKYDYFSQVITDYEAANGDISGMYRDPRGTLYHPHTGEEIPLGTLSIEKYRRPEWTFNKVLYCEKEGLFPILRETKWPERHDCALMTSKGFASRAARDLLDLLGETNEELFIYCVHDADASGTMIYQTLQEETRARAGRKVRILNLGFDPEEALGMRLQVEEVKREGARSAAVADYVDVDGKEWLQSKRVELNAMTTPQFLSWLDAKFAGEAGKVVPPTEVLLGQLRGEVEAGLRRRLTTKILKRGRLEERMSEALDRLEDAIEGEAEGLRGIVDQQLRATPEHAWSVPVRKRAAALTRRKAPTIVASIERAEVPTGSALALEVDRG